MYIEYLHKYSENPNYSHYADWKIDFRKVNNLHKITKMVSKRCGI